MPDSDKLNSIDSTNSSKNKVKIEPMVIVETGASTPDRISTSLKELSLKQWATIGMLACANLFSTVTYSCIVPFFPGEAQKKNLSTTEVGIIFGIFELVALVVSPLYGKYVSFRIVES